MNDPTPQALLQEAHTLLCERVRDILNNPDATVQELKLVKEFLKDNRIEALPVHGSPLGNAVEAASARASSDPQGNVLSFQTLPAGDVLDPDDPAIVPPTVLLGDGRRLG